MNEQKQSLSIPVAIIIAGALIAFGIYWSGRGNQPIQPATNTQQPQLGQIRPVSSEDHILGDPKAKIVLVEYSDTECPYCKTYHSTLHQLMKTYGTQGELAWVFRYFPVHEKSIKEAEAAECAAELGGNGAYWKYIDRIFALTDSNDSLDLAVLPEIAKELGLDVTTFNTCLSSGKYESKIIADLNEVTAIGAGGTPYSVLITNNQQIPLNQGALPYNDMKNIIDTILKN